MQCCLQSCVTRLLCRPEFWTIRQYSGFYKHSVETALFGAERLFQEMGYSAAAGQAQVLTLAPPQTGQHPVRQISSRHWPDQ